MAEMLTVQEVAGRWNIPNTQITRYCRDGRIVGAVKEKGIWLIPENAQKPLRGKKSAVEDDVQKPLPIGISDYRDACINYYYVDKTMLIKDFLDERPKVSLFTRPRRFGKTLAMDMLRTFFEKTDEDTSIYFRNKKIWDCGKKYRDYQGKYPVIFVTFKDIKCETWDETLMKLAEVLSSEFLRHAEVLDSAKCNEQDKNYFRQVTAHQMEPVRLENAFSVLSRMLNQCYGIAPMLIIDEYDTPIQQGHTKDFYNKIVGFMRNLFSGGLKDNPCLSFGFLTGILRVARESIFSGLNNLAVNSVLDDKYSEYFGFTPDEVREMAQYYAAKGKFDELCAWYDGYRFGNAEIFNPWSVINYFRNGCNPSAYWQATGSNDVIGEILDEADEDVYNRLNALMQGETVTAFIDTSVIYPEIKRNPSSIYSFLLVAGYLKVCESKLSISGNLLCKLALPNKEIALVYKKEVLNKLSGVISQPVAIAIQEAIVTNNGAMLQKQLQRFLMESVSSFDLLHENSYHMLLLGLCAIVSDRYDVTSNREAGEGRFDIQLMPKDQAMPGVLMELKAEKNCDQEKLEKLSQTALRQIDDRNYSAEMKAKGVRTIFNYGIAFSGKQVKIAME